jgi:hypothetical protein
VKHKTRKLKSNLPIRVLGRGGGVSCPPATPHGTRGSISFSFLPALYCLQTFPMIALSVFSSFPALGGETKKMKQKDGKTVSVTGYLRPKEKIGTFITRFPSGSRVANNIFFHDPLQSLFRPHPRPSCESEAEPSANSAERTAGKVKKTWGVTEKTCYTCAFSPRKPEKARVAQKTRVSSV